MDLREIDLNLLVVFNPLMATQIPPLVATSNSPTLSAA